MLLITIEGFDCFLKHIIGDSGKGSERFLQTSRHTFESPYTPHLGRYLVLERVPHRSEQEAKPQRVKPEALPSCEPTEPASYVPADLRPDNIHDTSYSGAVHGRRAGVITRGGKGVGEASKLKRIEISVVTNVNLGTASFICERRRRRYLNIPPCFLPGSFIFPEHEISPRGPLMGMLQVGLRRKEGKFNSLTVPSREAFDDVANLVCPAYTRTSSRSP
eukprot:758770-Hanusia_phi.AAC.1